MTRFELVRLLVRRWYVVLAVAVATVIGVGLLQPPTVVYGAKVNVMFLPPDGVLMDQTESLIYFAALVERTFNQGHAAPRVSSASATLYGAGVRQGYSVSLFDTGGQWQTNFNRPVLQVEVVDSGAAAVQTQLDAIFTKIDTIARQTQAEAGVKPAKMIRSNQSPSPPVIVRVGGSRSRVAAGMLCLGLGFAVGACYYTDRILARRRRRIPAALRGGRVPIGNRRRVPTP
ncbi:hypothetical protein [Specibacter sp. RAF43]|uniref:hypothetical protein n=1 Tax=Specibacter sp. RAF43 TaxID=3233057 RepID=UPI003F9B2FA5